MDKLELAIQIAIKAHLGQKDKCNQPYIGHPLRVMNMGTTIDEKICGILHDVIEDSEITAEYLEKQGFEQHIIDAVKLLTKEKNETDYFKYIENITKNPLALQVKLYDLTDNLDIKRYSTITEKDIERFNKYLKAYHYLVNFKNNK